MESVDVGVWVAPGPLQATYAAESKRHWKVEFASLELKPKVGVESLVGALAPEVIVVSGAAVSTVNERVAGVASTLPAWSVARTEKVWAPWASAGGVWAAPGPLQAAKAPESMLHWKVEFASLEEKPKVGVESLVGPLAPEEIVVSGAWESTVIERVAGLASVLPAWSTARTEKVWAPSESAVVGVWVAPGPLQATYAAASKRHWKVAVGSLDVKPKVGVESLVRPLAPEEIVVSGTTESSM